MATSIDQFQDIQNQVLERYQSQNPYFPNYEQWAQAVRRQMLVSLRKRARKTGS